MDKLSGIIVRKSKKLRFIKDMNVKITEDMSRPERIQWGELRKYMNKLSLKQPTSHFFLKNNRLYVDNRLDDDDDEHNQRQIF